MATPSRLRLCIQAWIFPAIFDRAFFSSAFDRAAKPVLFVLLSLPLGWLVFAILGELSVPGSHLGADPAVEVVRFLGEWSIRLLLLTLSVSSVRRIARFPKVLQLRRMIGLFAFSYVVCHFTAYLGFLAEFDLVLIEEDLVERTYITVGFTGLLLLVPLAVTSTNGWRRRLGATWRKLHRAIYIIVALGLVHLAWLTKDQYGEVVLYSLIFVVLMLERVVSRRKTR